MKREIVLRSEIQEDEITNQISQLFDYRHDGYVEERIQVPSFPEEYQIGLLVGSSGSGKTTILNSVFGNEEECRWDSKKSIASHFTDFAEASEKFGAVGLNSIPTWLKPYGVLSNGEKFRADVARKLHDDAAIDEFTSVVNREVARSCCVSLEKYIRSKGLWRITFCSCHDDIIPYLRPDWIYNTDTHKFYSGRYLRRPEIRIGIRPCNRQIWDTFKRYHYLSGDINSSANCYLGIYDDQPIAFGAVIAMPCGTLKHAYREHRVVVLPDYQGMGIGNKFSEAIAEAYHNAGCRYFSKTANPRMGVHRDNSPYWRATSKNRRKRHDYINMKYDYNNMATISRKHADRLCYSHEYIGDGIEHEYTLSDNGFKQFSIYDYLNGCGQAINYDPEESRLQSDTILTEEVRDAIDK